MGLSFFLVSVLWNICFTNKDAYKKVSSRERPASERLAGPILYLGTDYALYFSWFENIWLFCFFFCYFTYDEATFLIENGDS